MLAARIIAAQAAKVPLRILITGPTYTAWEKLFADTLTLLHALRVAGIEYYRVYAASHSNRSDVPDGSPPIVDVTTTSQDSAFVTMVRRLDQNDGIVMVGAVVHQCYRIAKQGTGGPTYQAFDFIAMDESSQVDVGKSLFPLCLLADAGAVVLLGDHLQMPPVVHTQPPSGAEWLVGSIQSYLIHRHGCPKLPLLINYRSGKPFVNFGKRIGYPLELEAHSPSLALSPIAGSSGRPEDWPADLAWHPALAAISDAGRRLIAVTYPDGRCGQANEFEADLVTCIVQQLYLTQRAGLANELDKEGFLLPVSTLQHSPESFWRQGIGIVTPHRAQRALIVRRLRRIFPAHPPDLIDAAVDTVERFQGGQRDSIIISFGVGDPDLIADEESFLLQLERTNVAISRARAKCVLAISDDLIYHLPSDRDTLHTSKAVKTYVSDVCRESQPFEVPLPSGTNRQIVVRWNQ